MASHIDVVVFDEDELVGELGIAHQLSNLLQHSLSRFIQGMGLPGKHELHWALRIVHHGSEPLDVRKNKVSPLIGCKPSREPDG